MHRVLSISDSFQHFFTLIYTHEHYITFTDGAMIAKDTLIKRERLFPVFHHNRQRNEHREKHSSWYVKVGDRVSGQSYSFSCIWLIFHSWSPCPITCHWDCCSGDPGCAAYLSIQCWDACWNAVPSACLVLLSVSCVWQGGWWTKDEGWRQYILYSYHWQVLPLLDFLRGSEGLQTIHL